MSSEHIATRARIAMLKKGLRQYDVAKQLGVHETAFSKLLSGRQEWTPEQLQKMKQILGLG